MTLHRLLIKILLPGIAFLLVACGSQRPAATPAPLPTATPSMTPAATAEVIPSATATAAAEIAPSVTPTNQATMALTWHREGGIAGFCDNLTVDAAGEATASDCAGQILAQQLLDPEPRQQLNDWLNTLQPFELNRTDPAKADAMTIQLTFNGHGTEAASEATRQEIADFAGRIFTQMTAQPTAGVTPTAEQQAQQTVNQFLTALMDQPSGASALDYLSPDLQAFIASGTTLSSTLGVENVYRSFGLSTLPAGPLPGQVLVEGTLNYVSPIVRDFALSQHQGRWLIDTIITYGMPAMAIPPDAVAQAQLILAYAQDLGAQDAAKAYGLLTGPAQAQIGEAQVAAAAQGIKHLSTVALTLTRSESGRSIFSVTFWVQPATGNGGAWSSGGNRRWFELSRTESGWRIAQISTAQIA